ncbi:MAG: long-chain fatty acid--CoA ligase [Actinobacteria bacterium]|nr:long-chain fatty acid--CoA ligase [Actinomycetota bacterium]
MHLTLLLDMAASGFDDRVAFGPRTGGVTYAGLRARAETGAAVLRTAAVEHLVYVATNGPEFPVALFAAARAGIPLVPVNYRLGREQLHELLAGHPSALVVVEDEVRDLVGDAGSVRMSPAEWMAATDPARGGDPGPEPFDPDAVALLLYTSGTTAAPKAAVLRHRHLTAYVMTTVEFASADDDAASLVSVPPYHIAGVSNTLSNLYAGRRVVHLTTFTPQSWLGTVRAEGITHALVVPTMLARVVEHLDEIGAPDAAVPTLRSLAYGGAPMPGRIIERALALLPTTDFVNAYGLTETSSTVAVLGPADHREAVASADPAVRARLGSAGRLVPGVEAEVRDPFGDPVAPGEVGELYLRGDQISGEYLGRDSACDAAGWFATRDRARIDPDGFLFIEGRADDTIIRGGENIAPAEIEEVLRGHPGVADVAVFGLPDEEWGQVIAAVVVPRAGQTLDAPTVQAFAREHLRSSKTPDVVVFRAELPHTETGKLLRRVLQAELVAGG